MTMQSVGAERGAGSLPAWKSANKRDGLPRRAESSAARWLADGLGVFSLALGALELAAPAQVARTAGMPDSPEQLRSLRAAGVREIVTGVGLLQSQRATPWAWARVAGDALDMAGVVRATVRRGSSSRLMVTSGVLLGIAALDVWLASTSNGKTSAARGSSLGRDRARGVELRAAVTIRRSPQDLYQAWRDLQRLPQIVTHLESVHVIDHTRSRWRAKAPAGITLEWEAELTVDRENMFIEWRSLPDADVEHAGRVSFVEAPGDRGTEVQVEIIMRPPGGVLGRGLAQLLHDLPETALENDLRRFKQLMELGEPVRSDASIHAGRHPAQPTQSRVRYDRSLP
jgi:uncharacterized membrane protein